LASTVPTALKKVGQDQFKIVWDDGHVSLYTLRYLRQNCPCAGCRDEWTGVRTLNLASIPSDIKALRMELVGNYAVHFSFSDHHETGIYSFQALRKLCPCNDCKGQGEL
jgi:DUF971 family protein